ncbi:MAG: leucine-rich repeat protein [Muribaculaceae bacterium]|nr:leucine-rich repeat protein [Muribaculaceae bacterium]
MKKLTLLCLAAAASLCASAFTSGGYNFTIVSDNEVEIARPTDTSEEGAYHDVISFPASVTYGGKTYTVVGIGERAFQYAEIAGSPSMPSSYRYVRDFAFFQAYGVAVKLGPNVTELGMGVFAGNQFANFLCDLNNPKYSLIYPADMPEGETWVGGVLATKDKETIVAFPGNKKDGNYYIYTYNVPSFVKHIASHAFNRNPNLRKVNFHEGVEDIGEYAFYECANLMTVEIPGGTKLGYGSFASNEFKLQSIILHEGIKEIPGYCFFDAAVCTDLQLPASLEYIGEGAFSNLEALTTLNMPEGLLACDPMAFANCTALTQVNVNDKLQFIGSNCFMRCNVLEEIDLKNTQYLGSTAFNSCSTLKTVKAAGLKHIDRAAFYVCTSLTSVELPETIEEIGPVAFMRCTSLTEVTIPASAQVVGDGLAAGATLLKNIKVAEGNQNYVVADGVLYTSDMKHLVSLPGSLDNTEFTVPAGVESIGEQAARWNNITKLDAGNVKVIGLTAFGDCTALTEVTFGAACDSINANAFGLCSAITKVTSMNPAPPIGGVFVDGVYTAATLYVPRGSKEAYAAHENWGKFTTIEEIDVEEPITVPGDLNGDNKVDVSDVNIVINIILGQDIDETIKGLADLNGDNKVDVSDVNSLINIILNN